MWKRCSTLWVPFGTQCDIDSSYLPENCLKNMLSENMYIYWTTKLCKTVLIKNYCKGSEMCVFCVPAISIYGHCKIVIQVGRVRAFSFSHSVYCTILYLLIVWGSEFDKKNSKELMSHSFTHVCNIKKFIIIIQPSGISSLLNQTRKNI